VREAFEFALAKVRPDSCVVRVYNEGLTGLLYDRDNEAALAEAEPAILFGCGEDLHDDEATMAALRSGRLLAFGMHGDDSIAMEVVTGDPLTPRELAGGRWLEAGPGYLDLPGGRLCIHSYNSLPIGDFAPEAADPGGFVDVPPGRYEVRLYRKDGVEPERDESDSWSGEDYEKVDAERISDVLVLTPADHVPVPAGHHNVLFGECIDFAARDVAEA
jgi:hypothetical protein